MTAQNIPPPLSHDLVPVSIRVAGSDTRTEVVGTVGMVEGELVVRIRPTQYQEVTGRRVVPTPDTGLAPHPFAGTCLRYMGPLTDADLARLSRPWWSPRRWSWWLW